MRPCLHHRVVTLAVAALFCMYFTHAQNTSPYWSLAGNANANNASKLGTTGAIPLRLFTNNIERMRISSTGNVGVGTINPVQKLHVAGNLNINSGAGYYLGNQRILSTPGTENLYVGYRAGLNSVGFENLFMGASAGEIGGGSHNTIIGWHAGMKNSGDNNTFCGHESGKNNTTGTYNTFFGLATGISNSTGNGNSVFGQNVLFSNTTGSWNCSYGFEAGNLNVAGNYNSYYGMSAGRVTTSASNNTFIGAFAGDIANNGSNNTFIGNSAKATTDGLTNSSAMGFQASATASNQVRLGNSSVTSIGGYADWTNISDGRLKQKVNDNVPGLEFINQLKPVTYKLKLDAVDSSQRTPDSPGESAQQKEQITYTGFIAQDVEKAAKNLGFDFSGVDAPKNDRDFYGLRYAQFVVPLVKAVQELDSANKALQEEIRDLKDIVGMMNSDDKYVSSTDAWIKQNTPNPFTSTTSIRYFIPTNIQSAKITLFSSKGQEIKTWLLVNQSGTVTVHSGTLAAGVYDYVLWVDGKKVQTKQMIIAR